MFRTGNCADFSGDRIDAAGPVVDTLVRRGGPVSRYLFIILLCLTAGIAPAVAAPEFNPAARQPADSGEARYRRLIVHFRDESGPRALSARSGQAANPLARFAARTGVAMKRVHQLSASMHVVTLDRRMSRSELESVLRLLRADSAVLAVEPDQMMRRHAVSVTPNDPQYSATAYASNNNPQPVGQWHLKANSGEIKSAIDAAGAWAYSTGSSSVVVAVLDSGVRFDHPDLQRVANQGRLLPGYDFVSADPDGSYTTANDGDGRDADPSDPGDWVDADYLYGAMAPPFSGCPIESSSWHGTRTAGIIGALTNNGVGIAGLDWHAAILPVRVLGRCGGYSSDILAGMRWAAGLSVPGVPDNSNPARIINLSLGGRSACTASEQSVIDEVIAKGVLVVASAGNETGPVTDPGDCRGVLAVAGLRHKGTKVGYSSLGAEVGISAPAGNCVTIATGAPCEYSIDTITNDGVTTPGANTYTTQFDSNVGTSFAAPQAAGVAALMLSIDPSLTPAQLIDKLQRSATPFPPPDAALPMCPSVGGLGTSIEGQCNCTTSQCGAGMLNALAAVESVLPAPAVLNPAAGWNLLGNGSNAAVDVAASFGDAAKVITVWKWVASKSAWAFYSPALADGGAAYAASKGYDYLSSINGGEGFWLNASQPFTQSIAVGSIVASDSFQNGRPGALKQGWNLVAIGNTRSAADFNLDVGATPPGTLPIPANVAALWAWDNALSKWYFYSPALAAQGGNALSDYIGGKGYLDFGAAGKLLGPGVGFWANKPYQ